MPRGRATPADAYVARTEDAPAPMKISVNITSTRNYRDDPTRARATVTLNDCFVVKGVRILRGENGLFVSMPTRKGQDGQYREMCHPMAHATSAEVVSLCSRCASKGEPVPLWRSP